MMHKFSADVPGMPMAFWFPALLFFRKNPDIILESGKDGQNGITGIKIFSDGGQGGKHHKGGKPPSCNAAYPVAAAYATGGGIRRQAV